MIRKEQTARPKGAARQAGLAVWALAAGLAGCSFQFGLKSERPLSLESAAGRSDRCSRESRTLSRLAALDLLVNDAVKGGYEVPEKLDELARQYLAGMPAVELGLPEFHRDTNEVEYYPSSVIRDGKLDGARLKDTGRWGYARNERQALLFIDCAHQSSRGRPWYLERGVF